MKNILIILFLLLLLLFFASQMLSGDVKTGKISSYLSPSFLETPNTGGSPIKFNVSTTEPQKTGEVNTGNGVAPKATIANVPYGYSESQLSPFFKQVRIANVSVPGYSGDYSGHFTLSANDLKKPVAITDWTLRSNFGSSILIPRAVSDYNPYNTNPESELILKPGEYVNVYSHKSAIGKNFRINKCMGFLNQTYSFTPALPNDCPSIAEDKKIITFTGACQDFLRSLSSCRVPTPNDLNKYTGVLDVECRRVADNYTYGNCYDSNRTKPDFYSKEYRVWLGAYMNFDTRHDRLLLFDRQGLLVDEYIY